MLKCFVFASTDFLAPTINRKKENINKHINLFVLKKKWKNKTIVLFMYLVFCKKHASKTEIC